MDKKATEEEGTTMVFLIKLGDELDFALANHEEAVAERTAIEIKDV